MKSSVTEQLEKKIYRNTKKQGVFGCFEVTIGWFGKERVDYLTYDTKGIWRCYEIKSTLTDFRNKNARITFVGHFNYYVMPKELYEQVKDEIPKHVGVYTESNYCAKKAKKVELGADERVLKDSLIRSLSRDVQKIYDSNNPLKVDELWRRLREAERQVEKYRRKYLDVRSDLYKIKGS